MEKARPIWQELPIHFKKDLVGYLDIKSRIFLQYCSKADQDLVKSCPIYLDNITVCSPTGITISEVSYKLQYFRQVKLLFQIFEHPKSFVRDFIFKFYGEKYPGDINLYLHILTARLENVPGFRIKSDFLAVYEHTRSGHGDGFSSLLKFFDASKLKTIELSSHIYAATLEEISGIEQWKNLKHFRGFGVYEYTIPIDAFLHLNKINIQHIRVLPVEKAWKIIESYLTRSLPLGSSFRIHTFDHLKMEDILKKFPVPPKNEPTETEANSFSYRHTQLFKLPKLDYILVVKFSSSGMYGAVCRKTHLNEDFQKSVFQDRIDK